MAPNPIKPKVYPQIAQMTQIKSKNLDNRCTFKGEPSMEKIKRSVGKAAWNSPNDVAIVQALLNRHRPSKHPLLAVDKAAGKRTIEAIQEF